MSKHERIFDPGAIEAEENFVIDFQFLLEELMLKHNVSRADLAGRAGISTARLSQLLSSEANPTAKTYARLFHALGEEITVVSKTDLTVQTRSHSLEWRWQFGDFSQREPSLDKVRRPQLVAAMKASIASERIVVVDSTDRAQAMAA